MFKRLKSWFDNGSSKNDDEDYESKKGIEQTNILKKAISLKVKLVVFSIVGFLLLFFLMIIVVLIALDIIDVDDIGGSTSGGLSYSENTYLKKIKDDCSSIMVSGKTYSLEDYVAGVVSAEAYTSEGIEALKAQAIAARTYAIVRTNNCTSEIDNSSYAQNFTSNINERALEATKATEGLVLTYNDQLFSTMYDSFYNEDDFTCDNVECRVTYTKLPNYEKHVVRIPVSRKSQIAGGHGLGMSQIASYDLAEQGKDYEYILNYFYSPSVSIKSLNVKSGSTSGLVASINGYKKRVSPPIKGVDDNFYFSSNNLSYAAGYVGECTWYAYGRSNEILATAGSNYHWNYAPDAKHWLNYNINAGAQAFAYSTDVTEPRPGAIIVWDSPTFGHVAVVEAVNSDGTIDYSEANIGSARSSSNPYGFRYQSHVPYTTDGVGSIYHIWEDYTFLGYIYMVE